MLDQNVEVEVEVDGDGDGDGDGDITSVLLMSLVHH